MDLLLIGVIVVAVALASVALMFAVRRRGESDYFFIEVERGAGVFAFLGTAFAVLLAFVVLEAFGSFNDARNGCRIRGDEPGRAVSHVGVLPAGRSRAFCGPVDLLLASGDRR